MSTSLHSWMPEVIRRAHAQGALTPYYHFMRLVAGGHHERRELSRILESYVKWSHFNFKDERSHIDHLKKRFNEMLGPNIFDSLMSASEANTQQTTISLLRLKHFMLETEKAKASYLSDPNLRKQFLELCRSGASTTSGFPTLSSLISRSIGQTHIGNASDGEQLVVYRYELHEFRDIEASTTRHYRYNVAPIAGSLSERNPSYYNILEHVKGKPSLTIRKQIFTIPARNRDIACQIGDDEVLIDSHCFWHPFLHSIEMHPHLCGYQYRSKVVADEYHLIHHFGGPEDISETPLSMLGKMKRLEVVFQSRPKPADTMPRIVNDLIEYNLLDDKPARVLAGLIDRGSADQDPANTD